MFDGIQMHIFEARQKRALKSEACIPELVKTFATRNAIQAVQVTSGVGVQVFEPRFQGAGRIFRACDEVIMVWKDGPRLKLPFIMFGQSEKLVLHDF